MNTIKHPQLDHKECVLMMPSYINARLDSEGQRAVQEHIAQCSECFDALQQAKGISDHLEPIDDPIETLLSSAAAKKSLMSTLERIDKTSEKEDKKEDRKESVLNKVVELKGWRRDWRSSSQSIRRIVIAQAACLMVALTFMVFDPFQSSVNYQTLSEPQKQRTIQSTSGHQVYRVIFHTESTEVTIRSLLVSIDGKIVNGPSKAGVYDVAVLNELAQNEFTLDTLRNSSWVKLAEPAVHSDGELL